MGKMRRAAERLIARVRAGGTAFGRARLQHLRTDLIIVAQSGVAVTLAWAVAFRLLHNAQPFFAPAIALGAVLSSQTRRLGQTVQLVGGVVLGVAVGELFILFIGSGIWQVGLSVMLAIALAIVFKGGTTAMFQAGSSAVLIATVPPATNVEFPRMINAAVGAVIGLAVVIVFLPLHPLRAVRRAVAPTITTLADRLTGSAEALSARDAGRAQSELDRFGDVGPELGRLHDVVEGAREVVSLAPIRWPRRQAFEHYERLVDHLERAVRNCQALMRRVVTVIEDNEPTPDKLPTSVRELGNAVRLLHKEFDSGRTPAKTREMVLCAVSDAGEAYADGVGFSGNVVVAQIRTAGTDLLRATGVEDDEANRMVRRAVGAQARARTNLPQV
jgi:uncharacterized membrane protein YgaE (UPF0421/DUF939 family)